MIDYNRMEKSGPKLKAALIRAKKVADPFQRLVAVKEACTLAVREWNVIGAWPDNWSLWQQTLDDAAFAVRWPIQRLEDL